MNHIRLGIHVDHEMEGGLSGCRYNCLGPDPG